MPPARRRQAEYGEERRLRLVRALIQIGGVPVAAAREVIAAAEDESLDHHMRLGAATRALPCAEAPAEDDPAVQTARRSVEALLERLGWSSGRGLDMLNPAHRRLIDSVAALVRLGYPCDTEQLLPWKGGGPRPVRTSWPALGGPGSTGRSGSTPCALRRP
ncbi:hypothetical protein ACH4VT_21345 [Streptomyces lydicus]|uniref:hypothetical protein n=1 Tax=Streptomyces lydicus TaxID=47763 RepID=UPI00379F9331